MTAPTLRELCEAAKREDHDDAVYDIGDWLGYPKDSRQYVPVRVISAIRAALNAEREDGRREGYAEGYDEAP